MQTLAERLAFLYEMVNVQHICSDFIDKCCEYVNMCNGMAGCRKYKRIDFAYLCKSNFKKDLGA